MPLSRRSRGIKPSGLDSDLDAIVDYINSEEYLTFTVSTAGTEVSVSHNLEYVPRYFIMAGSESSNGTGVVSAGTSFWTNKVIYLTATVAGNYSVIARR